MQTGRPQEIDYVSAGLGLSALNDAAKCGHAKCIEVFLDFNAAVDPRRKNGKTPMHENLLTLPLAPALALAPAWEVAHRPQRHGEVREELLVVAVRGGGAQDVRQRGGVGVGGVRCVVRGSARLLDETALELGAVRQIDRL